MNDTEHDVFFPKSDRNIHPCAYHQGNGTKLELERANDVFEIPVEHVPCSKSTSKNSTSGPYSSLSALEQIEEIMCQLRFWTTQTDGGVQCIKSPRQ